MCELRIYRLPDDTLGDSQIPDFLQQRHGAEGFWLLLPLQLQKSFLEAS